MTITDLSFTLPLFSSHIPFIAGALAQDTLRITALTDSCGAYDTLSLAFYFNHSLFEFRKRPREFLVFRGDLTVSQTHRKGLDVLMPTYD